MPTLDHGGNLRALAGLAGRDPGELLDFSANINPLGAPSWLNATVLSELAGLRHYPDPDCLKLRRAAADCLQVHPDHILAGNGTSDLLYALVRAAGLPRAVIPVPSFSDYQRACDAAGIETLLPVFGPDVGFTPDLEALAVNLDRPALVVLGRPNNPAGGLIPADLVRSLALAHPESHFCIDEAFGWFVPDFESLCRDRPGNVSVLLSLTKILAIPGLRLGLAVAGRELLTAMRRILPPWSVNSLAQAVGERAFATPDFFAASADAVSRLRLDLISRLGDLPGLTLFPGPANFILCRLDRPGQDADALFSALLERGLAIRTCGNFEGLDGRYFRIAVRAREENEALCRALHDVLAPKSKARPAVAKKQPPALMLLGTSSNAGKSLLAAAFCRILAQDGFRVAPFKAQNMALNSGVTADGKEMGRAQILQARACGLAPDARMNPVLLKPSSQTGSQVIVLGEPVGNMEAARYAEHKAKLWPVVRRAYDELAGEYEVMVLEGAGSPAEINLKAHDIVNTAMARHARAKALLVGDIDRGGVFAHLAGTMALLEPWERALVAGFVLNKFRGDPRLLADGPQRIESIAGAPVLGVVPYLAQLGLPEEDSVSFKQSGFAGDGCERAVDLAVIDLPHISNFTDFDALAAEPDVRVRAVRDAAGLGNPDAVILPGSKNVPADLRWLHESGLARAIVDLTGKGREVAGVCAGMQMLGQVLHDPHGIESAQRRDASGLGLLPLVTELMPEKTLAQTKARHAESGLELTGYEIHHGVTAVAGDGAAPAVVRRDGEVIGHAAPDGLVWGSYLHGLFDADAFRRWWIDRIRARKGLSPLGTGGARFDLEPALNRLAGVVRKHCDVERIYRLLGLPGA